MVKKSAKVAAILAAGALLFSNLFLSCSDDSSDDSPAVSTAEITDVSVAAESVEITATGSTTLTATPVKTGDPTITYAWQITEGGDYATLSESTSETVTLTGKNESTENDYEVTISVTASDGTNSKTATATVTVLKVGAAVTAKVIRVSAAANPASIAAKGTSTLTATPVKTGDPTITYTWAITEGSEYATLSESTSATVTLTGKNESTENDYEVTVSVTASDGTNTTEAAEVTVTVEKAEAPVEATTDSWTLEGNKELETIITGGELDSKASDGVTYTISSEKSLAGAESHLMLTLSDSGTGKTTTKATPNYAVYASKDAKDSVAGLRFKNDALKIANVKGKVVLSFDYTAAGSGSRNLEVLIGDSGTPEIKTTADTDTHTYTKEINAGTGTNIYIGASNNYWIKKISITENTAVFEESTNSDTENNVATLGLVGEDIASSNESIATAKIESGKISITSVSSGDATLTVTDKNSKTATIAITVRGSGNIVIGTITKFERAAPTAQNTTKASSATATDGVITVTGDGLGGTIELSATEDFASPTSKDNAASVTFDGLVAGTYYVRYAASTAYAESEAKTVSVGNDEVKLKTYTFTASDIKTVTTAAEAEASVTKDGLVFLYSNGSYKEEDYSADGESKASAKLAYVKFGGKYQSSSVNTTSGGKNYIGFKVPAGAVTVKAVLYGAKNADLVAGIYTSPKATDALATNETVKTKTVSITVNNKETAYGIPVEAEYTFTSAKEQTVYLGYLGGTGHFVSVSVTF